MYSSAVVFSKYIVINSSDVSGGISYISDKNSLYSYINVVKHYWSAALSELKQSSKDAHDLWASCGKPKTGIIFQLMKDTKCKYKLAIRDAVMLCGLMKTNLLMNCMSIYCPKI